MATLTLQDELTLSGEPTYVAADVGGDAAPNPNSRTGLWIKNTGGAKVLTIDTNRDANFGVGFPDKTINIPAGVTYFTPAFDARRFNDLSGNITFTFDDVTGVTIAAVERGVVYKES
jgi:hypothetical protein